MAVSMQLTSSNGGRSAAGTFMTTASAGSVAISRDDNTGNTLNVSMTFNNGATLGFTSLTRVLADPNVAYTTLQAAINAATGAGARGGDCVGVVLTDKPGGSAGRTRRDDRYSKEALGFKQTERREKRERERLLVIASDVLLSVFSSGERFFSF